MNALQEKIARYQEYCRADRELIAAHPDKRQYQNRLKNHEAKLARMQASLERKAAPAPEPEPIIPLTLEQYNTLESICINHEKAMQEATYPDGFWGLTLCNDDGGPVTWQEATEACFQIFDYDNKHDYDWLSDRLQEAGIPIPPPQTCTDGSGYLVHWGHCPVYGYILPLEK